MSVYSQDLKTDTNGSQYQRKEDQFNEDLFTKPLSKHSIGVYMELCRNVEVSFEAAVMAPCQPCA